MFKPNKKIFNMHLKFVIQLQKTLMIEMIYSDVKALDFRELTKVFDYKHTMKKSDSTFTIFHLKNSKIFLFNLIKK